MTEISRHFT